MFLKGRASGSSVSKSKHKANLDKPMNGMNLLIYHVTLYITSAINSVTVGKLNNHNSCTHFMQEYVFFFNSALYIFPILNKLDYAFFR